MKKQILQKMLELRKQYGEDIFKEPKRLLAVIKDYFPYAKHEHYLLSISLPLHLYDAFINSEPTKYISVRYELIKHMEQKALVPHQWAEEAVDFWLNFVKKALGYEGIYNESCSLEEKVLEERDNHKTEPKIEGNVQAILHKANCYYNGDGIEEDRCEALKWYEKAALLGSVEAMNYVGNIHCMGEGVPKDEALAIKWYEKAAKLGSSIAMNYLGNMYCEGRGVPLNFEKACYWYSQAIAKGNYTAMFNLGYVYCEAYLRQENGDFQEVLEHAKAGDIKAMYHIAYRYHWGEGIDVDYKAALNWYEALASRGEQTAMIWLAYMYFNGQGVEKNTETAKEWCEKAIKI